jgi:hypothetical protein
MATSESNDLNEVDEPTGIGRRSLLKRGAIVGAAAVWTVPIVSAISMTAAHAESPSGVPSGGGGGGEVTPPVTPTTPPPSGSVEPTTVASTTPAPAAAASSDTGSLAFTGVDVPIPATLGIATAAIALGAGALAASSVYNKQRQAEPEA